ncbi:unnamed protein product, partial [Ectocarpus sp. 12 AP-2014]
QSKEARHRRGPLASERTGTAETEEIFCLPYYPLLYGAGAFESFFANTKTKGEIAGLQWHTEAPEQFFFFNSGAVGPAPRPAPPPRLLGGKREL